MHDAINIRDWQKDSSREPVVRIGIVLDEDALTTIHLEILDADYRVHREAGASETWRGVSVSARLAGSAVALGIGDGPEQSAGAWRLVPSESAPVHRGQGVLVRGVVAGRGFHWQKCVDQTLCGTIELRPGRQGVVLINELPLEQYLAGVITAEMSGDCPVEFLKAQCVVARSWLLAFSEPKHETDPFDRCNDDCCQRYQGTGGLSSAALEAVSSTRGLALIDVHGNVVDANYSKSCGGISEPPETVWGRPKPGLAAIVDAPPDSPDRRFLPVTDDNLDEYLDGEWLSRTDIYCSPNVVSEDELGRYLGRVDETGKYFRWTTSFHRAELEELLRAKLPEAKDLARLRELKVTARGPSGRASQVDVHFGDHAGKRRRVRVLGEYRIREVLHPKFLYSSAFAVRTERDAAGRPTTITLRGAGWGHGAGLCQIGALGMALTGISGERICRHYFPDAVLKRVYD